MNNMDSKQSSHKKFDLVTGLDSNYRASTLGAPTVSRHSDHTVGRFNNFLQFWLTWLGLAVGYGNIWRFPYLLYSNGGGVFLIPFVVCIALVSFPIYYLETAYGQLYRRTLHTYYDSINSKFIGISFATVWVVCFMALYYNCLIAWSWNFFLFSFQSKLPWGINERMKPGNENSWNETYFKEELLHMSDGIFDMDHYIPSIIVSFIIVTMITFMTEFRSLDTAQVAVYLFIPLAYFSMFALFIKGIMLEGRSIGWIYLFEPKWEKLFTFQIWRDAVSQSIFSAGLGINAVILFASHKKRDESLLTSAVGIPILNFSTSIFAAITLFSFIGHASYKTGIPIDDMPIGGLELAFVAYPALLSTFPFPQVWTALFFFMLMLIGLSTQFAFVDVTCTFIQGMFYRFDYLNVSKTLLILIFCMVVLVIDILIFASNAGYYWVDFLDHYVVGLNLVICLALQLIAIGHYLPLEDMEARVEDKGEKLPKIYKFLLKYVTPAVWAGLGILGVINEIKNPPDLPLGGKILALVLFLLPNVLWITMFIWDPWNPKKSEWQADTIKIFDNIEKSS